VQVPILNGIYADSAPDLRTSYPRNYIPVPKQNGVSQGYLRPADGIQSLGAGGPGVGRGGINWNGKLLRVMGTKLVSVAADGTVSVLGEVGGAGQVSLDYGFDRLAIASGGSLFYWNGAALTKVVDPNFGVVNDVKWLAGYYCTTDGKNIVVSNLKDPTTASPLAYGSAEADPNPIMALDELRSELHAFTRYSIQVFQNTGAASSTSTQQTFPFTAIEGADVPKGAIGTHAYCSIGNTFVFLGSGRGEAPAVYMMVPGDTQKLSTREIDRILKNYTEQQLSQVVMEVVVDRNHQHVYMHLPDQCWVYDTIGSATVGEPIWFQLDSGLLAPSTYRGRNFVWCYNQWNVEDPTSTAVGILVDTVSTHYGKAVAWDFGSMILYNEGDDAIVHELELVALPGRVPLGADPTVWTSYSVDGETWSAAQPIHAGKQGERAKRLAWRRNGRIRNYRMQRFHGTSDAHLPVLRLELKTEPLQTRPGNG